MTNTWGHIYIERTLMSSGHSRFLCRCLMIYFVLLFKSGRRMWHIFNLFFYSKVEDECGTYLNFVFYSAEEEESGTYLIFSFIQQRKTKVAHICWFFSRICIPHGRLAQGKTQNKVMPRTKYFKREIRQILWRKSLTNYISAKGGDVILSPLKVLLKYKTSNLFGEI